MNTFNSYSNTTTQYSSQPFELLQQNKECTCTYHQPPPTTHRHTSLPPSLPPTNPHTHMGARRFGKSRPSLLENPPFFFALLWAFLLIFLHMGVFLLRFSYYWGLFRHVGASSVPFYSIVGALFGVASPLRKFLRAPMHTPLPPHPPIHYSLST